MANIINPYRYVVSGGGGGGGGDYVAITTSDATIVDEQFTYYDEYTYQNETISTGFKYAIFNGSGSINVTSKGTSSGSTTVDWLIIAGGGAGGNSGWLGAGGGAGGYREGTTTLTNTGSGTLTVGGGGTASATSGYPTSAADSGNDSSISFPSISTITSTGGGGGGATGTVHYDGEDGGSGGGAVANTSASSGLGTSGQGYDGGDCLTNYRAGGGGGASEAGGDGDSIGGAGGAGKWSAISAFTFTQRGGGGGGGAAGGAGTAGTGGAGGAGGGGRGESYAMSGSSNRSAAGTANTGGGGGGGYADAAANGKAGGSGVVILRWQASASNYPLIALPSGTSFSNDDYDTDYLYAEFDSSDYFQVLHGGNSSGSDSIEAYVIGGGGGGGENQGITSTAGNQGGGGAGGYIRQTSFKNGDDLKGIYNVTIGAGGATSADGSDSQVVKQGERSIEFDGSNDYINSTSTDWALGTSAFTVEAWVKIHSVPSTGVSEGIISTYYGTANTPMGWILELRGDTFSVYNGSGRSASTTHTPSTYLNKWIHLALVRSSTSSNDSKLYVNGELALTTTISANFNDSSGYTLTLGAVYSSSMYLDGQLANVRISDTARYSAAFNPSMERYSSDSNTVLLLQPTDSESGFVDTSPSPKTLSSSGAVKNSDTPLMRGFGGGSGGAYNQSSTSSGNGASACGWNGGSGGGGGYYFTTSYGKIGHPGQGFSGQGNDGGKGPHNTTSPYAGGGGGGAGAAGAGGSGYGDGDGGAGHEESWMSSLMSPLGDYGYFAGGGGGGQSSSSSTTSGGSGGGGAGGYNSADGSDGSTNTGGGGGGAGKTSGHDGGSGGSGKVILRWKFRN